MDHYNNSKDQELAQAIVTKTKTDLHQADSTLHMEFQIYVSYPPEDPYALVYFNTPNAMEVFNQPPCDNDANKAFNVRMNRYSKLLFDTHKKVKKELENK